jgi:GMP synthase-like glutamine amidotransferase
MRRRTRVFTVAVGAIMTDHRRLLIVDLSVHPAVYRPVLHWRPHVEALGVAVDVCRPPDGDVPADLSPYSHAILTGSEASILADTEWIVRACDLTRALDARQVKLLGSCFGHQMLARALAGRACVRRTPTPEFGWVEVRKADGGARDPLTDALPDRCHVYTSHFDEVFPLPSGWERVAATADCACAVVRRASGGAWGIQPHPEIGVEEGLALQASYLDTMPERRAVLEAGWHAELRDDRIAAALVRGFLDA